MGVRDQIINKAQASIPMDRQVRGMHLYQKAKRRVVGDNQPVFVEKKLPDVSELALTEIDVSNPFLYGQGKWHSYFKRLRDEAPVHYQANSAFGPYWSVTRYDDIVTVDKDFETFSAEPQIIIGVPPEGLDIEMFIAMDPPRHDEQRGAVQGVVAPRNLDEMEGLIRSRVQEVLDGLFNDTCLVTAMLPPSAPPHIEFLDYKTPPGGRPLPAGTKANDLWHWQTTLVTRNIAVLTERLRKAGAQFITPEVVAIPQDAQAQLGFKRAIMVRDPTGHALRLVEE